MKVRRFLSLAGFCVILLGLVVPSMTLAESKINFVDRVELISSEDISEDEMKERKNQKINIHLTEANAIEQQASSVTVVSSETKEVLFKITLNIDDVDVLTNEAVKLLKDNMLKDNALKDNINSDI